MEFNSGSKGLTMTRYILEFVCCITDGKKTKIRPLLMEIFLVVLVRSRIYGDVLFHYVHWNTSCFSCLSYVSFSNISQNSGIFCYFITQMKFHHCF